MKKYAIILSLSCLMSSCSFLLQNPEIAEEITEDVFQEAEAILQTNEHPPVSKKDPIPEKP